MKKSGEVSATSGSIGSAELNEHGIFGRRPNPSNPSAFPTVKQYTCGMIGTPAYALTNQVPPVFFAGTAAASLTADAINNAPFLVLQNGTLRAQNAVVNGAITSDNANVSGSFRSMGSTEDQKSIESIISNGIIQIKIDDVVRAEFGVHKDSTENIMSPVLRFFKSDGTIL